jgi:hypothetical protein
MTVPPAVHDSRMANVSAGAEFKRLSGPLRHPRETDPLHLARRGEPTRIALTLRAETKKAKSRLSLRIQRPNRT